jgi:uncharacterized protein (TIGR00251 family)
MNPGAKRKIVTIRVHPSSREAKIEELAELNLKVHVISPPEKGEANKEVVAALAAHFGLPPSRVKIIRGEKSRIKLIALEFP